MRFMMLAVSALGLEAMLFAAVLPRFDRELLLEQSAETSANVSIGDLNGDKVPDLVLAKGRHWPLIDRVLINDGHGRFTAHNLGEVADRSYSVTLTDIDRDGDLDVVVGNDAPDPKRIYANDGSGHFQQLSTFGRPEWPTRLATAADLNGDGLPDIVVANRTGPRNNGSNYVCLNRGKGRFDADCLAFARESATTVTPADVNRDGFIDLIVPHRDGGQSYVYLNDGRAGFAKRIPFGRADAEIRSAEVVDLNGDNIPDLVAIDERRGPFVSFGQPDATFSEPVLFGIAKATPYALATGDVDLDGRADVIVGYVEAPPVVFFNDGTGRHLTPVTFGNNKGTAYGFAIGDLDRDGLPDIAVARSDAPNVVYFAVRR
jgi:hypothetical protein